MRALTFRFLFFYHQSIIFNIRKEKYQIMPVEGSFALTPVGIIHSPFREHGDAPRQGRFSDVECIIEILPEFTEGLQDVEHHPHLIILYWLDRSDRTALRATPPHTGIENGVFATRSPNRPNPIGYGVVDLIRREGNRLFVQGLDALDGTPVLDIKPYLAGIDCVKE
jgi:formylmethanofuran dehydrogenase subunit E